MKESNYVITKKDLNQSVWRSILLQGTFNYERYQGSGWCAMMAPYLEKIYGDDKEELREALKDNSGFFNCQLIMTMFLQGLLLSLYEKKQSRDLINNSLFWFTLMPIMAGVCSSMANEGSLVGPAIYFIVYIAVFLSKYFFVHAGYKMGATSISKLGEKTKDLSTAASILGCTVIGGLIATLITFNIKTTISITDAASVSIQEAFFDQIIPGFLPVLITVLMYYLIKKKVSPTVLIVGILVVCLALSLVGIV